MLENIGCCLIFQAANGSHVIVQQMLVAIKELKNLRQPNKNYKIKNRVTQC